MCSLPGAFFDALAFSRLWGTKKAERREYFNEKDPKALPYLKKLVPLPENYVLDDATAKAGFEKIKGKIAAAPDPLKK